MTSRAGRGAGGVEPTDVDVEQSVRNRLYGERSDVRAVRVASTAVPARTPTQLVGERYRLLGLIGAGGMSNVYCARDELLKRRVAVKILAEPLASDPLCLRQFRREAELWAGLVHPLIVPVFDAGAVPRPFIVIELVPGVNAGALVRRASRPTCDQATRIVEQVAEALAFAHEHNVIHGDVSPGNVLIRRSDGAAKLTDFGLASRAGEKAPKFGGDVAGTYGYIPPEVLRGERVTSLSDLYSLGALAYRLLCRAAGTAARGGRRSGGRPPTAAAAGRHAARAAGRRGGRGRPRAGARPRRPPILSRRVPSSAPGRRRTRRAADATGGSVTHPRLRLSRAAGISRAGRGASRIT